MFTSIILELGPEGHAKFFGDHLHAWFMREVANRDPAIADRLHAPVRGKPFTVWAGPRFTLDHAGVTRDDSDTLYWLRITSVDANLSAILPRLALGPTAASVTLGESVFKRVRVLDDPNVHRWTGAADPKTLWARWMNGQQPRGRVQFRFLSPTAFSRGRGSTTLFPVAHLVFRSLIKTWNENVEPKIGDDLAEELVTAAQEESHALQTVPPLQFKSHRLKGFIGVCEYSAGARSSPEAARLLHLLADFAFFAGVGLKRTMGMGQVIAETI